ncbi:MAG: FecR domain-containing protein [Steroidobacteraceae bacterium]
MDDNDIENVLRAAGPRDRPPDDVERRVREQLRDEWRSIVAADRTRRRQRSAVALAAGLALAALGVWLAGPLVTGNGAAVGTVALASGDGRAKSGWLRSWRVIRDGESVGSGETLMTGPGGRVAVQLPGGVSVRLDQDTRITLASAGKFEIESGALYVDAGRAGAQTPQFEVVTPTGSLHHVGTQYEVRLLGSAVRVRVREGRVEWSDGSGVTSRASAGEQLTFGPGDAVKRGTTPVFGESWDWVAATTPGIEIDGRPLADFLSWAGRELGCDVVFSPADIENEAAGIVVHGSIAGLTPAQALDAVLATTRLQAQLDGGRIIVSVQETGRQPSVASSRAIPAT